MPSRTQTSKQSTSCELLYDDITQTQHLAIDALYEKNTLLIASKGFGKAMAGQTAVQALLADDVLNRVLVLAPLKVAQLTWSKEYLKWSHLNRPALALGDVAARRAAIEHSDNPIVVMNLENLTWLFETYGHEHGFDGLLIDEISKFKCAGTRGVKTIRKHLKDFEWRGGMSASPIAEAGTDIYAQALIIDQGKALGRNQEVFRRKHFYPTDFQQRRWAILPGQDAVLAEKLKDLVYVADDKDYEDSLPELVEVVDEIKLPPDARDIYDEMCGTMYVESLDIEAPNQAVVSGKLQQITAGAIYRQEEGQKHKTTHRIHDMKLLALVRLVRQAAGPVAIAYQFEFEKEMLEATFRDIVFLGDNSEQVEADWTAGKIRVMGLHPKSASHGLNLQYGGHELIVLTVPWSADQWEQLIGRFRRRGQPSPFVKRTVIQVVDSVDEIVLDRH